MAQRVLTLIFTKNRPLQLQACLQTLFDNATGLDDVIVYFRGCPAEYAQLQKEFPKSSFHRERNFFLDVKRFVDNAYYSHVFFVVDDTVFVRPFDVRNAREFLRDHVDHLGVTFRLGTNTTFCYTLNKRQSRGAVTLVDGYQSWNWAREATCDFAYPLEVSSTLYRLSDIRFVTARIGPFRNPNVYELKLDNFRKHDADRGRVTNKPKMACLPQSVCFSVPMNLTQDEWKNRHSQRPTYSVQALLEKFRSGWRMDVSALQGFVPRAAHQEVAFGFVHGHQQVGSRR